MSFYYIVDTNLVLLLSIVVRFTYRLGRSRRHWAWKGSKFKDLEVNFDSFSVDHYSQDLVLLCKTEPGNHIYRRRLLLLRS